MPLSVRQALENYRAERRRLATDGSHPRLACTCAFCDVVRAADLLHNQVLEEQELHRWAPPICFVVRTAN